MMKVENRMANAARTAMMPPTAMDMFLTVSIASETKIDGGCCATTVNASPPKRDGIAVRAIIDGSGALDDPSRQRIKLVVTTNAPTSAIHAADRAMFAKSGIVELGLLRIMLRVQHLSVVQYVVAANWDPVLVVVAPRMMVAWFGAKCERSVVEQRNRLDLSTY